MAKTLKSMYIRDIRKEIGMLVNELNKDLVEYYQTGTKVDIFENALETVKSKAGAKRLGKGGGLPKGWNLTKKSDLIAYKRELERLKTFNQFTPAAVERIERQANKNRDKFLRNHPGWNAEQYNNMIDVYRKLSPEIMGQIKYEQIQRIIEKGRERGISPTKIVNTIERFNEKYSSAHADAGQMISAIIRSISHQRG